MHKYILYGLKFASEIKLFDFDEVSFEKEADVTIAYGKADKEIYEDDRLDVNVTMSPKRARFMNNIGFFTIENGNSMTIEPREGVTDLDLSSFIIGWCMAFLFQQRGASAIHSSAIRIGDGAILICGGSGSGKSTTAMNIIERGYKYLADDIAMVEPGKMMIYPAFPQQKVCRDVADSLDGDKLLYVDDRKDKFAYKNEDAFCKEPAKLKALFILDKCECESVYVEKVTGVNMLSQLMKNLFLLQPYMNMGFPNDEKVRCLMIAGQIDIYIVHRPVEGNTVNEVSEAIINMAEK